MSFKKIDWVDGVVIPIPAKLALVFLSACSLSFVYFGYEALNKTEGWPLIIFGFCLSLVMIGFAFYKSWVHIDPETKTLYLKKRFLFTRVKSYSYRHSCLTKSADSATMPNQQYSRSKIGTIYIRNSRSGKIHQLFSSNQMRDYVRVMNYLKQYINVCE